MPNLSAKPILLIDDDPDQVQVRELLLQRAGFTVASAHSAESALDLLRKSKQDRFGAILTDHLLPGVSGAEFVKQLRAVNSVVPVVVITGLAEAEEEYAGLNVSFREKPFAPEELIRLLKSLTQSA